MAYKNTNTIYNIALVDADGNPVSVGWGNNAYTVATLPAGVAGLTAYVTDGDAALAWGATVVNSGAGATKYLCWFNGTNWTVVGK